MYREGLSWWTAAICVPSGLKSSARRLAQTPPNPAIRRPVDGSKTSTSGLRLYGQSSSASRRPSGLIAITRGFGRDPVSG
jgi:hypothetical protein